MNKRNNIVTNLHRLLVVVLCFTAFTCTAQEAVRVTYLFYHKADTTMKGYNLNADMTMDFDGKNALFYSDATYQRDSLELIAFDKHGNTVNDKAYGEIYNLSGKGFRDWICFIDHQTNAVRIHYNHGFVNIEGNATLPPPKWELTNETQEISGYLCKKAYTRYLGRTWTAWYAEDLPFCAGPWLLRGLPGLIVSAEDTNKYFVFELRWMERCVSGRYDVFSTILAGIKKRKQNRRGNYFASFPLEKADQMATRTHVSSQYHDQLIGMQLLSGAGYMIRNDGSRQDASLDRPDYLSIIPPNYWKK